MKSISDSVVLLQDYQFPIIVEGKKDAKSLQLLGAKNTVTLSKPLFKVVEQVSSSARECMILTDLDKEGKQLYSKLKKGLQLHRVKVNDSFRNFLFRETKVREIEGLYSYLSKLKI